MSYSPAKDDRYIREMLTDRGTIGTACRRVRRAGGRLRKKTC